MSERAKDNREEMSQVGSPDEDLVHRARKGDETACHEIVDRYSDRLYGLAFSLVGNAADAADVLQETFSGAFRHLRAFRGRSSLRTWLSRILFRQAARHHRSRRRHKAVSLESIAGTRCEPVAGGGSGGTQAVSDARMDVGEALRALSPLHREVIVLRELEGMSYEEIAAVLGVPRGTVESRLFRARGELRGRLRDYLTLEERQGGMP
ncbi:MAG: sigma-70 family RNA polymerase sigma factor [Planctomycetota bacterium]